MRPLHFEVTGFLTYAKRNNIFYPETCGIKMVASEPPSPIPHMHIARITLPYCP